MSTRNSWLAGIMDTMSVILIVPPSGPVEISRSGIWPHTLGAAHREIFGKKVSPVGPFVF